MEKRYSDITPYIHELAELSNSNHLIEPAMYEKHHVQRGLRDINGNGVVAGLTEISCIKAKETLPDGAKVPCDGQLFYRGVNIRDLVNGFMKDGRYGFEEAAYLLLMGELPDGDRLSAFSRALGEYRSLPSSFVRDMILKAPGRDMMNIISRCVLALYTYDDNPDDISVPNVLRQSLQLIANFPLLAVYSYQAYLYYHNSRSLYIQMPKPELSTAENLLHLMRGGDRYTELEARILDLALVLHAEHGGGNNSSFTMHVVTSSGTDTYSAVAAALGSLRGPRHGGANIKVVRMFDDMKQSVNICDKGAIKDYLVKLLRKEAFDRSGLIYGMGHAVYSKSDPRADILRSAAQSLAVEENLTEEYELYETVAELAPQIIAETRKIYKGVSANVDFYSGLVYRMLGIPDEMFTPIFAIARIAGWSAHRIEEIQCAGKIIRPGYTSVKDAVDYVPLEER